MRFLYSFLFYLALPFIFLRLLWRSRRSPAYRKRLAERLGYYPFKLDQSIWVHAVSMGETIAAVPLIKALQARYPNLPMVVTTMTPTGAERVNIAFGATVQHAYIPYDVPSAVERFLAATQPVIGIIMETELWPNLFALCHRKQIPVCVLNARLSAKSAQGYQRIGGLVREMLQTITRIAAHGIADAERLIALGAPKERVSVTGSIKFDLQLAADLPQQAATLRAALGGSRFIWVAASTHEGEETQLLAAHRQLREQDPEALLILVPRHLERFDAVAKLCEQAFKTTRRSTQAPCTLETAVYLGDSMGELLLLYACADVAFVGGSLIPRGGHNMLEAGALGKPIVTGPSLYNFAESSALFITANALTQVADADALAHVLIKLMQQPAERAEMGQRARAVMEANRGALAKQLEIVNQVIAR